MADTTSLYRRFATGRTSGWQTTLTTCLLFPFSLLYGLIIRCRNLLYSLGIFPVADPGIPVIAVGNIAAGGTGKTPVVDYLVKYLVTKGHRVGIVSRGYGGAIQAKAAMVSDGQALLLTAEEAGDEPVLLARRNPDAAVAVSPKRIDGIRLLIDRCHVDCVVLDDAFQHRSVARDLDIVLFDGRSPLGNGRLLPAGILREPFSATQRADLAVLTHCEADCPAPPVFPIQSLQCRHQIASTAHRLEGGSRPFTDMRGQKIFAFAGIAEPETFFSSLHAVDVELIGTFAFPDHVAYTATRLATLISAAGNADLLLTTEKDAVKLDPSRLPIPCYSVGVQAVFEDDKPLLTLLDQLLDS